MDDQELHDLDQAHKPLKIEPGSRQRLEAALRKTTQRKPYRGCDPIEMALANHPGLTREKAEEMAERQGFDPGSGFAAPGGRWWVPRYRPQQFVQRHL
jgi:hypothetical protein